MTKDTNAIHHDPKSIKKRPTWPLSVRHFVAFTRDSGHLLSQGSWRAKDRESNEIRNPLQNQRPPQYQVAVRISERFTHEHVCIQLQGRLDGLLPSPLPIIEEIKTTVQSTETLQTREDHWLNLYCHAWLFLRNDVVRNDVLHSHVLQNNNQNMGSDHCLIQLTYYNAEQRTEKSFCIGTTRKLLDAYFQPKLTQYFEWLTHFFAHRTARNAYLKRSVFPYEYERPQQVEMMSIVRETLHTHDTLLLEASTGIGKTAAVTFPALQQLSSSLRSRLLCLSAKITTQANTQVFLALMSGTDRPLKVLQLTAQERLCACLHTDGRSACPMRLNYYRHLHAARQEAYAQHWLDTATIQNIANQHAVCPYRLQFEILPWVDVIIADYNYVFDPRSNVLHLFEHDLKQTYVLIDECHNLIDRARDMHSMTLSFHTLRQLLDVFFTASEGLHHGIHAIIHEAQRLQSNNETLPSLALQRACHSTLKHLEHALRQSSHVVDKSILEAYFDLHFFHRLISANLESIQLLPDPSNSNPSNSDQTTARQKNNDHIALCCVDPSPLLHPLWQRLGGVVLYSGTLQPVSYYQRLLGLSDGKTASFLRSFAEQVHTEVIPLDLRYRQRTQHIPAIMTAIMRMCTLKPGNHFIFFSSYAFMQQVHQQFVAQHPSIETHIQTHRMSLTERMRFLDKFQPEPSGNRVGFVVMGGVFGEGVDLPGDRLKGVMLVSIALPTPDARAQAIEQYFTDQEGSGFAYAYLYPSLCRTLQASGRLIRTDEDEGVLMLVDRRFAQATFTDAFAAYQPILPSHEENDYTEDGCYL